jgi:hypothetical protein
MLKKLLGIAFFVFLLVACRNNNPRTTTDMDEEMTGFDQIEEVKEIYYRFPSPDEMLSFIDREKIHFDDRLLLPVEYANSYLDSRSQALNLGVYIADMAYVTLFQRQKEAYTYFQVIYGLSDKLRISSAFDIDLMQRLEENFKNPDSLKVLADIALNDITSYLISNDKEKTFAIISIGGFVESLHLAFNLAGEYDSDSEIVQRISDQKYVLDNIINYALEFASDQNVSGAISLLHPIRGIYNELHTSTEETTVTKADDGKLLISGGSKISITKDQYEKLRQITLATRKKITENLEN